MVPCCCQTRRENLARHQVYVWGLLVGLWDEVSSDEQAPGLPGDWMASIDKAIQLWL